MPNQSEDKLNWLPPAVRAAVEAQDSQAFQEAMDALPTDQASQILAQLQSEGIVGPGPASEPVMQEVMAELEEVLAAIAEVAKGNPAQQAAVEAALPRLEQAGYHLTGVTQRIWAGERGLAALAAAVDSNSGRLTANILERITGQADQNTSPNFDAQALARMLPPALMSAIENQDEAAFQAAFQQLTHTEQTIAISRLASLQAYSDTQTEVEQQLSEFDPFLSAVAAVVHGNEKARPQVEDFLDTLTAQGLSFGTIVRRILAGERDADKLTTGLNLLEASLVKHLLELL